MLWIGNKKYCVMRGQYRGFWSVKVNGLPETEVTLAGVTKEIGSQCFVIFRIMEPATYTISATYQDETETKSIILDDTGVYVREVNMFIGFTLLEYLQGDGQAYINSGLILDNNSSVESKFQYTEAVNSFLYGGRVAFNNKAYGFSGFGNNVWQAGYGNSTADRFGNADTDIHIIKQNKNLVYLDNVLKATIGEQIFSTQNNAFIFAMNQAGDARIPSRSKIWYLKMWDNEELVRDYIPVKRTSDNKPGMLDLSSGQFFTNQGTGEFIAGPVKE